MRSFKYVLACFVVLSLALCGCSRQGEQSKAANQIDKELTAAWNSHDPDRLTALFTDDCVYEDVVLGKVMHGKEELRAFAKEFFDGIPDLRVELKSLTISGDRHCAEWVISGTQTGVLLGLPVSGKSLSIRGASVTELKDGKVQRNTDYYDGASLFRQLGVQPQTAAADPFVGTWKMNVAKSTKGSKVFKSWIEKIESQGDISKWTSDGVDFDGNPFHLEWSGKYDGKDYPLKGSSEFDASAAKRIDAKTIGWIDKKAGQEMATWQFTVSTDGKTQSWTGKVRDAKGQEATHSQFFEKQ